MPETVIWTQMTTKGVSDFFTVTDPPITISVDGLLEHERVMIRSAKQGPVDVPVPFRTGGSVKCDYNNTKIIITCKGRFCLELVNDPKNPIDAHRE